ncbi:MAG: hypothetical protein ACOCP8_01345 [archaeon]
MNLNTNDFNDETPTYNSYIKLVDIISYNKPCDSKTFDELIKDISKEPMQSYFLLKLIRSKFKGRVHLNKFNRDILIESCCNNPQGAVLFLDDIKPITLKEKNVALNSILKSESVSFHIWKFIHNYKFLSKDDKVKLLSSSIKNKNCINDIVNEVTCTRPNLHVMELEIILDKICELGKLELAKKMIEKFPQMSNRLKEKIDHLLIAGKLIESKK